MLKALLKWTGVVLLLLLSVALITGAILTLFIRSSLPWTKGSRDVDGLAGQVEILRDGFGIPHIYGKDDEAVYFALGYAHAQDRLWQMSFNRWVVQGRLAEIVGANALDTDVFFRALDLDTAAARSVEILPQTARVALEAYARGVNAVLDDPEFKRPPEFLFFSVRPERWQPADSLATLKLMGLTLSTNANTEFERARMRAILGPEKAADYMDPFVRPNFVSLNADDLGLPLRDRRRPPPVTPPGPEVAPLPGAPEGQEALDGSPAEHSNNWVVDGRRTVSGLPLLANDPHLRASMPGIWYLAHLSFPDTDVVGVTLPGIPAVLLGRNDSAAWAFTNTGPDTQDLYVVTRDPEDAGAYVVEDGVERFVQRSELIEVKGAEPVTVTFKSTRHGPVMPKGYTRFAQLGAQNQDVALAWTLLDDQDTSYATSLGLMRATSYEEARALGRDFVGPMQNILYADIGGTIGYLAPGKVPVRRADHDSGGLLPVDGSLRRNDWQGTVPYDELPFVKNPGEGLIVTANNQIVPDRFPYAITNDWIATERARRIDERLRATPQHDLVTFAALQNDVISLKAQRLVRYLLRETAPDGLAGEAQKRLAGWNGAMDGDAAEPLIYVAWIAQLERLITADDFGADFPLRRRPRENFLITVLSGENEAWCDVVTSPQREECGPLITRALELAVEDLRASYGDNIDRWRWKRAHRLRFPHQPLDAVPVLSRLFSRSTPAGGGIDTVNVAPFSAETGSTRFDATFSASMRAVYDLSDLSNSRMVITTGQSGHILSEHFDDIMPLWRDGRTIRIETDRDRVRTVADRLILTGRDG
ncbi:MAG: penicillin acylase family protein [Alphaproteobacteria bacterium]